MKKTCYVTTAIDYVNALPHVGTAYEKIGADVLVRFKRLQGAETFFLMGVDEHSTNVERRARENGLDPQTYCDGMASRFEEVWRTLGISYDRFIRTSEETHKETVREIFRRLETRGDIYKGVYKGWYCVSCEAFLKEADLQDGLCPSHKRKPDWIEEHNYFFRLSRYTEAVARYIREHPAFIRPESRRNEILQFLSEGLEDISVSRAGTTWGIECPFDAAQRIYVWFDALINYLSGAGFSEDAAGFTKRWPADLHIIGKDITRFHCIIWPAMLMAADLPLPKSVWGHGFVHLGGEKMSKTQGTLIDPVALAGKYGADAIRYFLLREVPFDRDGDFTMKRFTERYSADLANDLGNLCQRTLVLIRKYRDGNIPAPGAESAEDTGLRNTLLGIYEPYCSSMEALKFNVALEKVWSGVVRCNKYIDETAPWSLRKDPEKEERFATVLYNLCEALRIISVFISPFMPQTASAMRRQLGIAGPVASGDLKDVRTFGMLRAGGAIGEVKPLFPRLDDA
jgi:methionyl-tRNA synthetase